MKRVDVHYGGFAYTIPDTTLDAVQAQIMSALRDGEALWLRVNYGSGSVLATDLLITSGTPVALAEIDDAE
ncbi:hypothetical protein [Frigoribacterium sp. CFBP9030]|uniref:hypothetical protein n=1 Tax=Frigoribacterium sp. CFBP9030 TaxID=3096537 RepID=UPI002A6AEE6D|nr:hypothetical protein [Frigoribacterium sp. CFBP9030]MDY0892217.1 hypothetical protein [Frigoribacterium sp. CFBP9030]